MASRNVYISIQFHSLMGAVRKDKQEGEETLKISHISTSTARHFLAELSQLGGKAQ